MSLIDELINGLDTGLRTLSGVAAPARPSPSKDLPESLTDDSARSHAAGLMRVNHTGEVCAQALYEGQALTASDESVRLMLREAGKEEQEHLAWCRQRLDELESRPSVLDPAFYALSYGIGAVTGLLGDRVSLGFVHATERQVCDHLERHLTDLPADDARSRAVVEHMIDDEQRHGDSALASGGAAFPEPVQKAMTVLSKVMTETSYRI
ncbi:MAG: 2-polyprenyl-3-methyl-6-methoxy-1,4-benzoquinone monooxygenase [Pseudomonadaceae bacterium]|nr:2-polyprenyl-3-methyl-6-methoxy-1,4-benzoquinone monooxygenase [Pseudomonadaceae bacterium]